MSDENKPATVTLKRYDLNETVINGPDGDVSHGTVVLSIAYGDHVYEDLSLSVILTSGGDYLIDTLEITSLTGRPVPLVMSRMQQEVTAYIKRCASAHGLISIAGGGSATLTNNAFHFEYAFKCPIEPKNAGGW